VEPGPGTESWAGYRPAPVRVAVEDLAAPSCHLGSGPHSVITFDGARTELHSSGTFLLLQATGDGHESHVRARACPGPGACLCGLVAREGRHLASIDTCHSAPGPGLLPRLAARGVRVEAGHAGGLLRLLFPSGRSYTVHLGETGGLASLSLQTTGADWGRTRSPSLGPLPWGPSPGSPPLGPLP
jgi:hypothetical protein